MASKPPSPDQSSPHRDGDDAAAPDGVELVIEARPLPERIEDMPAHLAKHYRLMRSHPHLRTSIAAASSSTRLRGTRIKPPMKDSRALFPPAADAMGDEDEEGPPSMPNSIEDILVCIHDEPELDEHSKLGRMVREVDVHLVPFGHYTATERVRIGRAFRDKNLGTQLSDRIADMIHTSRRRVA
jgi:hypothetical protein